MECAYAKIRTKLQTFYGKQVDSLNEMVDKTMNGRRVSKGDATAHTALLSELYRIDVAANERPDVSESRKREWITRLLQTRLEYMKESFHEEENKRVRLEGKTEFTFTDFIDRLELRIQTLGQMGKPSTSARVAAIDTATIASDGTYTNPAADHATTARIAATATAFPAPALPDTICAFCRGRHHAETCDSYLCLNPDQRADRIRERRLCFTCLTGGHSSRYCQQTPICDDCGASHHTTLHGRTRPPPGTLRPAGATSNAATATTPSSSARTDAASFVPNAAPRLHDETR